MKREQIMADTRLQLRASFKTLEENNICMLMAAIAYNIKKMMKLKTSKPVIQSNE